MLQLTFQSIISYIQTFISLMNKTVTVILLLLVVSLSKNLAQHSPLLLGGYEVLQPSALNNAEEYQEIQSIINFARTYYEKKNGQTLGKMVAISRQLVAGWNYKIVFQSSEDYVQIIVFDQSWTQTRQVTETQKLSKKKL